MLTSYPESRELIKLIKSLSTSISFLRCLPYQTLRLFPSIPGTVVPYLELVPKRAGNTLRSNILPARRMGYWGIESASGNT